MIKNLFGSRVVDFAVRRRLLVILVVTLLIGTLLTPSFLTTTTAGISLDGASVNGIVAVGLTSLLMAGQIDLSGAAVVALSAVAAISLQGVMSPLLAAICGVLVGSAVGLVNGLLVVVVGIDSLIATLASMLAVEALALMVTNSQPVTGTGTFGLSLGLPWISQFTQRTILFIVAALLLHAWVTRTVGGRHLLAIGSNIDSTRASGVPVNRFLLSTFVFAGTMAGIAGVVEGLTLGTASPVVDNTTTVTIVAAVVIGGTRLEGGRGSALGTLGGVLTLAALSTVMDYHSVPTYWQDIVTGSILIVLVLLDQRTTDRPIPFGRSVLRFPLRLKAKA